MLRSLLPIIRTTGSTAKGATLLDPPIQVSLAGSPDKIDPSSLCHYLRDAFKNHPISIVLCRPTVYMFLRIPAEKWLEHLCDECSEQFEGLSGIKCFRELEDTGNETELFCQKTCPWMYSDATAVHACFCLYFVELLVNTFGFVAICAVCECCEEFIDEKCKKTEQTLDDHVKHFFWQEQRELISEIFLSFTIVYYFEKLSEWLLHTHCPNGCCDMDMTYKLSWQSFGTNLIHNGRLPGGMLGEWVAYKVLAEWIGGHHDDHAHGSVVSTASTHSSTASHGKQSEIHSVASMEAKSDVDLNDTARTASSTEPLDSISLIVLM